MQNHTCKNEVTVEWYRIIGTLLAGNIRHNILGNFCTISHMTQPLFMGDLTRSVAALAKIDLDCIKI